MSRLISAEALENFFYSPESGTHLMIDDAIHRHFTSDVCETLEDELYALCEEMLEAAVNIIDTEETALLASYPDAILDPPQENKTYLCLVHTGGQSEKIYLDFEDGVWYWPQSSHVDKDEFPYEVEQWYEL